MIRISVTTPLHEYRLTNLIFKFLVKAAHNAVKQMYRGMLMIACITFDQPQTFYDKRIQIWSNELQASSASDKVKIHDSKTDIARRHCQIYQNMSHESEALAEALAQNLA